MRRIQGLVCLLVSVLALGSCADATDPDSTLEQELALGKANISLSNASATLSQTSDTTWTLAKTGAVDTATNTVTWQIAATRGATVAGRLAVNGYITVTNTGTAPATIGNIVVNLQTKTGAKWVTRSSDVADATQDDAATTAKVVNHATSDDVTTFTENAASGRLVFMDASTNSVFALSPQRTIAAGATVNLLYSAEYDNNVLGLPVGTAARAEVVVTFGNNASGGAGNTASNLDINGNGVIDADEAKVRSVAARLTATVPATQQGNAVVTLSDTLADISTTGSVTFANPVFNLGATTGTVRVTVDGGASGGAITNCAHLTGSSSTTAVGAFSFPTVSGIDLVACDTQAIGAAMCLPGAPGCGWEDGDMITYSQNDWGAAPATGNAAALFLSGYSTVYLSTSGVIEIGLPGTAGFSARFTTASALLSYLPSTGSVGALNSDLTNPLSTVSGGFGGDVLGLKLDVDYSDAGFLAGAANVKFGDLRLCNFAALPSLDGMTVRGFLDSVNSLLGGGTAVYDIGQLSTVTDELTRAFSSGAVSTFAQEHLFTTACP